MPPGDRRRATVADVACERRSAGRRGRDRRLVGRASQLSDDHVQWTFIDEIASGDRSDRC